MRYGSSVTGLKQSKKRPADGSNPARTGDRVPYRTVTPECFSLMLSSGLEMVTEKKVEKFPTAEGGRQSGIT